MLFIKQNCQTAKRDRKKLKIKLSSSLSSLLIQYQTFSAADDMIFDISLSVKHAGLGFSFCGDLEMPRITFIIFLKFNWLPVRYFETFEAPRKRDLFVVNVFTHSADEKVLFNLSSSKLCFLKPRIIKAFFLCREISKVKTNVGCFGIDVYGGSLIGCGHEAHLRKIMAREIKIGTCKSRT